MKAFIVLFTILIPALSWGQTSVTNLNVPLSRVQAGSVITIDITNSNGGAEPVMFRAPAVIPAILFIGQRIWPVELVGKYALPMTVAPGAFATRHYNLTVPGDASGPLILELKEPKLPPARAVIEVVDSSSSQPQPDDQRAVRLAETASAVSAYARTFDDRLGAHEPIYFIYGGKAPAAKFQFSVKYRLLDLGGLDGRNLRTLQASYTQRSLWDIDGPSSPFYDTSYMPEMFFQSLRPISTTNGDGPVLLGYQTGFKHESNGRSGATSRSLNTVYFRTFLALGSTDRWHLVITPEVFGYVGGLGDNEDLKNYRGHGQLRAALGYKNGVVLVYNGLAGQDLDHATTQLDLSVPIHNQRLGLKIYFLIQYFNGYGESLLRYNEKSESLRAGISLVR